MPLPRKIRPRPALLRQRRHRPARRLCNCSRKAFRRPSVRFLMIGQNTSIWLVTGGARTRSARRAGSPCCSRADGGSPARRNGDRLLRLHRRVVRSGASVHRRPRRASTTGSFGALVQRGASDRRYQGRSGCSPASRLRPCPGGHDGAHHGGGGPAESRTLAGGRGRMYTIHDAYSPTGPGSTQWSAILGSVLRAPRNAQGRMMWKIRPRVSSLRAHVGQQTHGLLVLNQYYRPGVEATANLLADLCASLASDYEITVVTGRVRGQEDAAIRRTDSERCSCPSHPIDLLDRSKLHLPRPELPHVSWGTASYGRCRLERPAVVLCMTDPPIVGDLGLGIVARRHRVPLIVVSQDVFPEIATAPGRRRTPRLVSLLRAPRAFYHSRADKLIVIGERMRDRLIAKGPSARIEIARDPELGRHRPDQARRPRTIPTGRERCQAPRLLRRHALGQRRPGSESRQSGAKQRRCRSGPRASTLPIIRASAPEVRRGEPKLAEQLGADREYFFVPYQPRERLSESLSAADVHYVGLGARALGLRRTEPPVRDPRRRVARSSSRRTRTARPTGLVSEVGCGVVRARPIDRTSSPRRSATRTMAGSTSRRWAHAGREYVVAQRRSRSSRSAATARSFAGSSAATAHESPPGHAVLRPGVGVRRPAAGDERLRLRAGRARTRGRRAHDRRARRREARRRRARRCSTACASGASRTSATSSRGVGRSTCPAGC